MKKLFLFAVAAGLVSVTSCKKETKEVETVVNDAAATEAEQLGDNIADKASEVYEDAKAAVTDAPSIENPQLQEWVNKLHDAAAKAKAASYAGDQTALNEAVAEMTSLNESLSNFSSDPEYAKAEAYYKEIQAELEQTQM
ncbi:Uncharacterised protein [Candidatus Ornithobacterium hominis]|uniref:Lipoprotein n=1 Tax=Candidatus Ornithobacterium hominis TaxID=2497989 RepID=A0A383U2G3_9FLAO|nr:hypothetical protein [Candidatus Ornithobacterium hominis]MCT7905051.1 hypothetical protein [Candidatus Ornithobacterium hominis]SZD74112.1 Uncharacterised protein [Candidatus Ornithobacterium hominis]